MNDPDYPTIGSDFINGRPQSLTKREYFATMSMQGMIACTHYNQGDPEAQSPDFAQYPKYVSRIAVEHAESLIDALNDKGDINDGPIDPGDNNDLPPQTFEVEMDGAFIKLSKIARTFSGTLISSTARTASRKPHIFEFSNKSDAELFRRLVKSVEEINEAIERDLLSFGDHCATVASTYGDYTDVPEELKKWRKHHE